MPKLYVIGKYRDLTESREWQPGQVVEVDDSEYDYLLRDAPGCFATEESDPTFQAIKEGKDVDILADPQSQKWDALTVAQLKKYAKMAKIKPLPKNKPGLIEALTDALGMDGPPDDKEIKPDEVVKK